MARVRQEAPVAEVPAGDPMTLIGGNWSLAKINLYCAGVDQAVANSWSDVDTARYCREMLRYAPQRLFSSPTQALLVNAASPDTGAANSLFTFMAQRLLVVADS